MNTAKFNVGVRYTTIESMPIHMGQILKDQLRYLSPNATAYNTAYVSGYWDGFVNFYDTYRKRFPTGLLYRVKGIFKQNGITVETELKLPAMPQSVERIYKPKWPLRDYQEAGIEHAIKMRRGCLSIPTGGGKTEMAQEIIARTQVSKVVFYVPSRAILNQTVKRFREAFPESEVIQWGDSVKPDPDFKPDNYILIATVQSAFKNPHPMIEAARMIFIDEAHHQAADTFKTALEHGKNARYIYGLSATPFRADGADMEIEAWIGPIIIHVEYEDLIQRGFLVPPEFMKVYTLADGLAATQGMRTLIFSETVEALREIINYGNVVILTGKETSKTIKAALQEFRAGKITHIACTPIFDEGLDVPDIEAVFFFSTCGSKTRAIQRIGRGMRPGKTLSGNLKTRCLIVDLHDDKYRERVKAYEAIPAFASRL